MHRLTLLLKSRLFIRKTFFLKKEENQNPPVEGSGTTVQNKQSNNMKKTSIPTHMKDISKIMQ